MGTHSPLKNSIRQRSKPKGNKTQILKKYTATPERAKGVASGPAPGHVMAGIGSKIVGGESNSYGI